MGFFENMIGPGLGESLRTLLLNRKRIIRPSKHVQPSSDDVLAYFEKVYCINLPERADRRRHVTSQFERIGLRNVEWVNAVKPNDNGVFRSEGTHGCALTHRKLFQHAKQNNLENILIFEDDVAFCKDFVSRIEPIIAHLRTCDWDIFYFFKPQKGVSDIEGKRGEIISRHPSGLVKTTGTVMTHAYAIHNRCLDLLLEKTDPYYMQENIPLENRAIDKAIAHLKLSFYACSTDLTFQNQKLISSIDGDFLKKAGPAYRRGK